MRLISATGGYLHVTQVWFTIGIVFGHSIAIIEIVGPLDPSRA